MPAYATPEDLAAYRPELALDDADALRLLEDATRDLDLILGTLPTIRTGDYAGHKLNPGDLATFEARALSRATCAQAEHRHRVGPDKLNGRNVIEARGPDFAVVYARTREGAAGDTGRYSPQVATELAPIAHLRWRPARARP